MKRRNFRQVLDCASPLALSGGGFRGWSFPKAAEDLRQSNAGAPEANVVQVAASTRGGIIARHLRHGTALENVLCRLYRIIHCRGPDQQN
jgi:hypothetical protein